MTLERWARSIPQRTQLQSDRVAARAIRSADGSRRRRQTATDGAGAAIEFARCRDGVARHRARRDAREHQRPPYLDRPGLISKAVPSIPGMQSATYEVIASGIGSRLRRCQLRSRATLIRQRARAQSDRVERTRQRVRHVRRPVSRRFVFRSPQSRDDARRRRPLPLLDVSDR